MIGFLAKRNLLRQRARTLLTVLGLGVTTALLYDMALLAGGLRASLTSVLDEIGYELRVLPKGGLPFSSDAALPGGRALARAMSGLPGVSRAAPLWATTLHLYRAGSAPVAAFALGLDPEVQSIYRLEEGPGIPAEASGVVPLIVNRAVADSLHLAVGDTLVVSAGLEPAGQGPARPARAYVAGIAMFRLDFKAQRSVSTRLADLQRIAGREAEDPAAFVLGKLASGAPAEPVIATWKTLHPETDLYSVAELMGQVRGQLSYFRQFSLILGTVSLITSFLLILTLLTLSVNERQGEFAILRALGLRARRVVGLVLIEGLVLSLLALGPGLVLGSLASIGLDAILKTSPGIPADLSFFVFTPEALGRTVGLVLLVGTLAGAYPALLAARTDVVATLHREVT